MSKISVTIDLPSDDNATAWDFSTALLQASAQAMMQGELIKAKTISRLQILIQLPHEYVEYYSGQRS